MKRRVRRIPVTVVATGVVTIAAAWALVTAAAPAPVKRPAPAATPRRLALTFDDLPGAEAKAPLADLQAMNRRILEALRSSGATATGFVNEGRTQVDGERDARVALLRAWLDAGCDLGNHTEAHLGLTETPLRDYEDGVVRGEAILRTLLESRGRAPVYFRHPFTQTGPTPEIKEAFERFLRERGYTIAPFTVEAADYLFSALYDQALAARARGRFARRTWITTRRCSRGSKASPGTSSAATSLRSCWRT